MSLFERKHFISHAGLPLEWKVECDALTDDDWETLALMISERCKFSYVEGIPRGGMKLANALQKYCYRSLQSRDFPLLIVDDVCTTGKSLEVQRGGRKDVIGFVVFSRNRNLLPNWCGALWVSGEFSSVTPTI